jgi:CYTH domain-containing protein
MGKEIERKFLVHADIWSNLDKPKGNLLRQGYLTTEPHKTIRVRATNDKGFITIKGISIGATRAEYEYEIPKSEAIELLDQFAENELSKIRYEISFDSKIWEVDVFSGANEGLIVAEIELESEQEVFTTPDWVAQEVTEDKRYFNSNLSLHPFKEW